jgi:hypothetical protein
MTISHFTVVVIGEDVDGQLEPYNENLEVEPYWDLELTNPSEYYRYAELVSEHTEEGVSLTKGQPLEVNITMQDVINSFPPIEREDYRVTAEGALERRSTYNPHSKWDWWVIGGRWEGFFLHVDGRRVDQLLNRDWDRVVQREMARADAAMSFDKFEQATKGLPHPHSFTNIVERLEVDMPRDEAIRRARPEYHDQPFIKALAENELMPWLDDPLEVWHLNAENPREAYITSAMLGCAVPFAYVKDGEWHERGRMGWFAMARDEVDEDVWNVEVNRVYDSLDDEMLTNCDCHI